MSHLLALTRIHIALFIYVRIHSCCLQLFQPIEIQIDEDSECKTSSNGDTNPFCDENIRSAEEILKLHSSSNYEPYCLSYLFTDRVLEDNLIGFSWLGTVCLPPGNCEQHEMADGRKYSFNTGIITFASNKGPVPEPVSHLALAHEIGHNLGSPVSATQNCRKMCIVLLIEQTISNKYSWCSEI